MATTATAARPRKPVKLGRLWWRIHSWLGLNLCILMSFILATGTLATVAHEIDWMVHPAMRVAPLPATDRVNWAAITDAIHQRYPGTVVRYIDAPIDRWFAAEAIVATPAGEIRRVHAHPETGAVQGDTAWFNVQRLLRDTHRHLLLPVAIGIPLVGVFAIVLLVSGLTSLSVYKRWWRGLFKAPRRTSPRIFWSDLHRLGGVWSLPFLLLIGITGVWYLVEELGLDAPDHVRRMPPAAHAPPPALPLDAQLAAARRAFPGLAISHVTIPRTYDEPTRFEGDATAILVRPRSNAVEVDPRTGARLLVARGEGLSVHQRISEMADPLHFGTFGGIATKLAWFVFGLILTGLSLTGAYIYGLRVARGARADG